MPASKSPSRAPRPASRRTSKTFAYRTQRYTRTIAAFNRLSHDHQQSLLSLMVRDLLHVVPPPASADGSVPESPEQRT